jgi:hypothetical protein
LLGIARTFATGLPGIPRAGKSLKSLKYNEIRFRAKAARLRADHKNGA